MSYRRLGWTALILGLSGFTGANAWAQATLPSQQGFVALGADSGLGVTYLPFRSTAKDGKGVRLSESGMLHLGIGAEAGYDTNVFFQDQNAISAPLLRVIPYVQMTNAGRDGAVPPGIYYDLSAALTYREYLSDDENVKAQRAFNPTLSGVLEFGNSQALTLSLTEQFARLDEPPYGPSTGNIIQNFNMASAQLKWAPGGGRFSATLRYTNMLSFFDNAELKFANNMGNDGTLDLAWRWLPRTSIFLTVSQGYISYFDSAPPPSAEFVRSNSLPFRALAGLRGLLTNKLSLYLGAGYTNGFYSGGVANPSGVDNLAAIAEVTYKPTLLTDLIVGYRNEFRNSPVVGNFYGLSTPYVALRSRLAERILLGAFARFERRTFDVQLSPTDTRNDNFVQGGVQADVNIAGGFYAGVSYIATVNNSNADEFFPGAPGLDYLKQLILGRLGVMY
jgi:hypothetical protein